MKTCAPIKGPQNLTLNLPPKSRHNVDGWWTSVSTLYVDRGVLVVVYMFFGHLTVRNLHEHM